MSAWTAALILMALSEAVFRTSILAWRGMTLRRQAPPTVTSQTMASPRPLAGVSGAMMENGERPI